MKNLLKRALLMAAATPGGSDLAAHVRRAGTVRRLIAAAEEGRIPISAISAELEKSFPSLKDDPRGKQVVGLLVSAILHDEGFEVSRSNVRISTGAVFQRGSEFRRASKDVQLSILHRWVEVLTEKEAAAVVKELVKKYPRLKANVFK